ncbi:MAG: hypothetical protein A3F84_19440 [Candidatus Handelsmanbacteria bacterium RIFCSPLOWO2_12_FULL_64_10]|uniref:Uncharacterized protein n=1 Tax=Handelsmanbacteria sp. (strain RIFCSPLOWO2_12_FULL_64_10) TaxID=1817868 RepID=A0A1F6CSX1_HANXR|nr:MAG: hypothetical protein A3F84_19440 [Candidatus Handelsmanbacteria bacterium RIFCSPLOWO2_12_FULL_64_10]
MNREQGINKKLRDDRRTLLIDDLHRRAPSGAVARSPSPRRWLVEPMDGGPALVALPGSRVPDLILSPEARGFYEVYVGLCSLDGQPSEVEAQVGDTSARLRLEGGEVDCREVAFGRVDMTGRQVALRHPAGARSCVTHVKLVPR